MNGDQNQIAQHLMPDCEKCFGLCCVALYFSKDDGFPTDKNAGTPCPHLNSDFRCDIYVNLETLGMKGCICYDCFGAGQQVSQVTFRGVDWSSNRESAQLMFDVFWVMCQLHEIQWYLLEALSLKETALLRSKLSAALEEILRLCLLDPQSITELNLSDHRKKINPLLRRTSELVRKKRKRSSAKSAAALGSMIDLIGIDLRKTDLRHADLGGAFLIASNMEGMDLTGADMLCADMRDANIKGANLSESVFLTQFQVNTAIGDSTTKLPAVLRPPRHWTQG